MVFTKARAMILLKQSNITIASTDKPKIYRTTRLLNHARATIKNLGRTHALIKKTLRAPRALVLTIEKVIVIETFQTQSVQPIRPLSLLFTFFFQKTFFFFYNIYTYINYNSKTATYSTYNTLLPYSKIKSHQKSYKIFDFKAKDSTFYASYI